MNKNNIPVVVTTAHRGVFFGYAEGASMRADKTKTITEARMCVYWSSDVRGVVGLAANGPTKSCKVTPAAPEIVLSDVTSVMLCSPAAAEAWERGPWS